MTQTDYTAYLDTRQAVNLALMARLSQEKIQWTEIL
jgi:hypothetical protein